jgi:hypothetical protein
MSSKPWEPDRPLNVEIARSVIRAAFPHVDVSRVEYVGSGWEFDVYVTADGWAFRFPRRVEYQSLFEREAPVLALARSILPRETAVPLVELTGVASREFPYTVRLSVRSTPSRSTWLEQRECLTQIRPPKTRTSGSVAIWPARCNQTDRR